LAESFGLETRFYHLLPENSFRVDVSEIKRLANERTKILFVNSPHNPTGTTLSNEELRTLHDFAAEHSIQFVSDEVYHPLYHGRETISASNLPHATVVGSFSKVLSLSGFRVGWIVERNEQDSRRYLTARQYFTISNAALDMALAEVAVLHREAVFARTRQVSSSNLALLDQFFAQHADQIRWVRPQGGTIAFPWLADGSDARPFCQALAQRGVLLAPGDCFDMPPHFRLGFGASERFADALKIFTEFLLERRQAIPG
jgi:aspartate/methionine/tyrosine aminotransferase